MDQVQFGWGSFNLPINHGDSVQEKLCVSYPSHQSTKALELGIERFSGSVGGAVWEIVKDGIKMVVQIVSRGRKRVEVFSLNLLKPVSKSVLWRFRRYCGSSSLG